MCSRDGHLLSARRDPSLAVHPVVHDPLDGRMTLMPIDCDTRFSVVSYQLQTWPSARQTALGSSQVYQTTGTRLRGICAHWRGIAMLDSWTSWIDRITKSNCSSSEHGAPRADGSDRASMAEHRSLAHIYSWQMHMRRSAPMAGGHQPTLSRVVTNGHEPLRVATQLSGSFATLREKLREKGSRSVADRWQCAAGAIL